MVKQTKLFSSDEEPKVLTSLDLINASALALHVQGAVERLCERLKIVGSIRRQKIKVGDCDFVIVASDANWAKIAKTIRKCKIICAGPSVIKINIPYEESLFQVDFYRATLQTFGIQTVIRTGSADHNIWLASYAQSKSYKLKFSEGLSKDKNAIITETEESFFATLGLPCPEPQQREIIENKPVWFG
jgi:DNA polymerase/3'-5' exonuclease PolX